ncbi:hypothetical protein DAPPUDRAFT_258018 [Daphnia pulex]|uniref:Uncharacterized protein n=1 Tax=Daphnia pulex TaxID=6669 RepID=E9HEM9_DAPPU|nr:hypothetical protein DAPPUDRAFT_258018 [Daphnia pulex]|eukprot:EFX69818.1 hypothetical protein DAPPUDRAFT_258018 [Daphnia pulex]
MEELKSTIIVISSKVRTCLHFSHRRDQIEQTGLYDASQRDNRNKATNIFRLTHELDKTCERKDQLTSENKKLGGV